MVLEPVPLRGLAWFLAPDASNWIPVAGALWLMAVLLMARMALRRDRLAWAALFVLTFGVFTWSVLYKQPWASGAPLAIALGAGTTAAALVAVLARSGLLAGVVCYTVGTALLETPLTYDVTRWYAWRTGAVVALIAGLAFWGFRNVLGRQSAFPESALDG